MLFEFFGPSKNAPNGIQDLPDGPELLKTVTNTRTHRNEHCARRLEVCSLSIDFSREPVQFIQKCITLFNFQFSMIY